MYSGASGHSCVVGLQWGDEGKGKVVDFLMGTHAVVARYGGGANAGHTIVVGDRKFALHQIPSGIIRDDVVCVLACGMVIDPAVLLSELEGLKERGISAEGRLWISDRAHLVLPYHRQEDLLVERAARDDDRLGTTARGIGPCYRDKAGRHRALRVCDLREPQRFREKLAAAVAYKSAYFAALYDYREAFDADHIADEYLELAEQFLPYVCDTTALLHRYLAENTSVLFEGAQGALLDLDHGTFPFVTSSNTGAGGAATGAGVPPRAISRVIGIVKAYTTRVGAGPFPTEQHGVVGETIRERGREFGTTTGRPRRCGWFDAVATGYAARTCGPTELAVAHLDTLAGMDELQMCVGYRLNGTVLDRFPASVSELEQVEPIYERFDGWAEDIGGCRRLDELPAAARRYLDGIAERVGAPIGMVGVGPEREQAIIVDG